MAMLVGACVTASSPGATSPSPEGPRSSVASSSPSADPAVPASPAAVLASIDAAQSRWNAQKPSTYAYTFTHIGPSGLGWDFHYRVTSLDGHTEVQSLDGYERLAGDNSFMSIDGQFARVRQAASGPGSMSIRFDPIFGYPAEVSHDDSAATDSDWTDTVPDFRTGTTSARGDVRSHIAAARVAWQDRAPGSYEYLWRRFEPAGGPDTGTAWDIVHTNGRTSTEADPVSDHAGPADASSIESTFDAVIAAADGGAWVDLTVAPVIGVPLLVAVDPSSTVTGDEYWIRINFKDTERDVAQAALDSARTRWAAAGLQHYSYTWRYRGRYDPLTYWMTLNGEVASIRRALGTPITEASAFAVPRIDDTFEMIGQVLAEGGRVHASYDPIVGYPIRVEIDPGGAAGPPGTITISDFAIR